MPRVVFTGMTRSIVLFLQKISSLQTFFFQVSAILIGPGHQMMLFKPNNTGHSDWLKGSEWYVGDEWNHEVDSINIDY